MNRCSKCNIEIEDNKKMCFNCYLESNGMRLIEPNEIIVDIDDLTLNGAYAYHKTGLNLLNAGYRFEIWYAEGQKYPHMHIKNIPHIAELEPEKLKTYKKLFLEKYIPKEHWNEKIPDYSLCNKHPIAEENKPHLKYKTIKKLLTVFNPDNENFCEKSLFLKSKQINNKILIKKSSVVYNSETIAQKIASKISILSIADQFGLMPLGMNLRVCPFHADSNPSLSLNEENGLFNCFACHTSGNIIKFYVLLKKLNPGVKLKNETSN